MMKLRIVFMGTPEFAVESLRILVDNGYDLAAVVTVPDKPAGRGLKMKESAVKDFAVKHGLPVLQPQQLKDPAFIKQLEVLEANLFIIVAFRKLPDEVWMMPELGTFNLHASLLPQYRGAAPINHAVMNGETTTGVTTFFLNSCIDTGKIIKNLEVDISPDETAGELHDKLMLTGASLLLETVRAIADGSCTLRDQPEQNSGLKSAPRIFREHCLIDWKKPASEVHNLIRGLSPYPGAYSIIKTDKGPSEVKILRSASSQVPAGKVPGNTLIIDHSRLYVTCGNATLEILQLQSAGKKVMSSAEFLRGLRSDLLQFGA